MTVLAEALCPACGARFARVGLVSGDEHGPDCSTAVVVHRAWSLSVTSWSPAPFPSAAGHGGVTTPGAPG